MYYQPSLGLHVPVALNARGRILAGELYLPKRAQSLRVCIARGSNPLTCRRLGSLLSNAQTATLMLHTEGPVSAGEFHAVLDWVRSRRLLAGLTIKVVASYGDVAAVERTVRRDEMDLAVPA